MLLLWIIVGLIVAGWIGVQMVRLLWFLLPGILFMALLGWLVGG